MAMVLPWHERSDLAPEQKRELIEFYEKEQINLVRIHYGQPPIYEWY